MQQTNRRLAVLVLPLLAAMACGEPSRVTDAPVRAGPRATISDGANGGAYPQFFFLPPIAAAPSYSGTFSAAWRPTITICLLSGNACVQTIQTIGPENIAVSTVDQKYQAQWLTDGPGFAIGNYYRITVTVPTNPATALGFVDVLITAPGQAEGAQPGGIVAFNYGRTVPIAFRIETGLFQPPSDDAGEFLVPNSGAVIKVNGAAVYFSPGWLGNDPPVFDPQVTVLLVRIAGGTETCKNPSNVDLAPLLFDMEVDEGCYRLLTVPAVADITADGKLGADVIFAMCTEVPETGDRYQAQTMFKYDAPSTLLELENVAPYAPATVPGGTGGLFLSSADCEGFSASSTQQFGMLWNGARALARGFGKVFGPNTAWALDAGLGGKVPAGADGFSDFFFGVPPRIQKVASTDAQTAEVGTALALDPTALVTARHDHGDVHPLGNIQVTFEVQGTGGSLGTTSLTQTTAQVMSIPQGQSGHGTASIAWVMPADPGTYSLKASVTESPGDQTDAQTVVYFSATAVANVPRSGKEVRIVGPESPGSSSNVYMTANVARPFNAKAYIDGKSTNLVCLWTAKTPSKVKIVPSGTGDPGSVSITVVPGVAGGNAGRVDIQCGTGSGSVSRTIFFYATA